MPEPPVPVGPPPPAEPPAPGPGPEPGPVVGPVSGPVAGPVPDVTSDDDPPPPVMCDEPPRTPSPHDVVVRRVYTPNIQPRLHNGNRDMPTSNQFHSFP